MQRYVTKKRSSPENDFVRDPFKLFLEYRGWYVKIMGASAFMAGFPDLYAHHDDHGTRLIECKLPDKVRWTRHQLKEFPEMIKKGVPLWCVQEAGERAYRLLFEPPNLEQVMLDSLLR